MNSTQHSIIVQRFYTAYIMAIIVTNTTDMDFAHDEHDRYGKYHACCHPTKINDYTIIYYAMIMPYYIIYPYHHSFTGFLGWIEGKNDQGIT